MNKRIAKTLLILCIVYMIGYYILKFIFPEQLVLMVTDENIIKLGKFLDNNVIFMYALNIISTFATLYLFVCASSGRFKFKWFELLYILAGTLLCFFCALWLPSLYTHTSISIMFLIALLCKSKMIYCIPSFIIHGYLSQFLFTIRGFEAILQNYTTVTGIVLMLECYVWLLILALFYNLKEVKNEFSSTIFEQNEK